MYRLIILAVILSGCSGAWTLKEDNDFFGGRNSDQNYTQGLRVSQDTEGVETYVGQLLYTPANKQLTTYQPNQRPYAGYLYAGQLHTTVRSPNIADTKGLTVGIIGPHAYGEQTQNTVHKWIKNKTAKGWGNHPLTPLRLCRYSLGIVGTPAPSSHGRLYPPQHEEKQARQAYL